MAKRNARLASDRWIDDMKFKKPNDGGNEPSPLIMIAIGGVPLLAVAGWFLLR